MMWRREGKVSTYDCSHVNSLESMARRYNPGARIICITDDSRGVSESIETFLIPDRFQFLKQEGHWIKLAIFSEEFSEFVGDRFLYLDLDNVVTGDVSRVIGMPGDLLLAEGFMAAHGKKPDALHRRIRRLLTGKSTPRHTRLNSSVIVVEPGAGRELWDSFDLEAAQTEVRRNNLSGSDQAWIALKRPDVGLLGRQDGVFRFTAIPEGLERLDETVRIVHFSGRSTGKPWHREVRRRHPWVEHVYPDIVPLTDD